MGTHPIFESDFDCLTDVCFVLDQLKKCVTSLPIFLLNSVETMPQMLLPSKPSSEASVLMPMKKTSPLSHLAVVLPQPLAALLPPVVLLMPQLPKKRRLNHPRAKTKIWDSVFSTKTDTTHTVYVPTLL